MNKGYTLTIEGNLRILIANEGYKIYSPISNTYNNRIFLSPKDSVDNYRIIKIKNETQEVDNSLEGTKKRKIALSKENLAIYLQTHPLLSYAHNKEGGYYGVDKDHQDRLSSNLMSYQLAIQAGQPPILTWNEIGKGCEVWTQEEAVQLALEIKAYVAPLISLQQHMETEIVNSKTIEEVLDCNIEFTEEVITEYKKVFYNMIYNNNLGE